MNGNIALSMEIGSAYALQVCLLQVPALVFFSALYTRSIDPAQLASHSFKYVFHLNYLETLFADTYLIASFSLSGT